jgi:hypothetical protein
LSTVSCCATRSIAAMRSTSERLARAACEAVKTAALRREALHMPGRIRHCPHQRQHHQRETGEQQPQK